MSRQDKYYEWKRNLTRKYAQKFANHIIKMLDNSVSEKEINSWINLGVWLDTYCVYKYDIYLN